MSMPKISDINPEINLNRDDAVNIIIASIAMEELALAHIINAEGEKLQYVLGTLDEKDPGDVTICDVMAVNTSVNKTLREVTKTEMLLQFKLESAIDLLEKEDECQLTIRGKKIWRDGGNIANTRPETVQIYLLRDNELYRSVTLSSSSNGNFTFACLPLRRDSEHEYVYRIDEENIDGYTKSIEGYNITNTVEPGNISIACQKIWNDEDNTGQFRPAQITVNLLQNNVLLTSQNVSSPPDTQSLVEFSFDNLEQFDSAGNPYEYTIEENEIDNYETNIDGFVITNTLEIGP